MCIQRVTASRSYIADANAGEGVELNALPRPRQHLPTKLSFKATGWRVGGHTAVMLPP
jgi:hypothetical protein